MAGLDSLAPTDRSETTGLKRWVANPRALLGYMLVLGAVAGTAAWVSMVSRGPLDIARPGFIVAMTYYSFSGFAGVQLLRGGKYHDRLAIWALLPQLVQVQGPALLLKVVSGLSGGLIVGAGGIAFHVGAESAIALSFLPAERPFAMFINVVPAVFLAYLYGEQDKAA
jgi:hypothetical protein